MKVARKSKRRGHFRGFLAVAAFPSELSTRAYARSPRSPRSVTSAAFSSSPIMDLTGYRHRDPIEPSCTSVVCDMAHLRGLSLLESMNSRQARTLAGHVERRVQRSLRSFRHTNGAPA